MQMLARQNYAKYQRSWPLQKCQHELKYEQLRKQREGVGWGGKAGGLDGRKTVAQAGGQAGDQVLGQTGEGGPGDGGTLVSTPSSDPDRLSLRIVIRDLQSEPTDNRRKQSRAAERVSGCEDVHRFENKHGYYGSHATQTAGTGGDSAVAELDDNPDEVKRRGLFLSQHKRKTNRGKLKSRQRKKRREYLFQNDYDLWRSEQIHGLPGTIRESDGDTGTVQNVVQGHKENPVKGQYMNYSSRAHQRETETAATIIIQAFTRGWLARHFLHKLRRKTSEMAMPWRTFGRDYLRLVDRVRERNITVSERPRLDPLTLYKYIERQAVFDDIFDGMTKLTLPKTSLAEFVKRCDVKVTPREIEEAYRWLFKGVPKFSAVLLVSRLDQVSLPNMKRPLDLADDILRKFQVAPFIAKAELLTDLFREDNPIQISDFRSLANGSPGPPGAALTNWAEDRTPNTLKLAIAVLAGKPGSKMLGRAVKFLGGQNIPIFVVGHVQPDVASFVPSRRVFSVRSDRQWTLNRDTILENILRQTSQQNSTASEDSLSKNLHRAEAMDVVWTLHNLPGSGCAPRKETVSLSSIFEGLDVG